MITFSVFQPPRRGYYYTSLHYNVPLFFCIMSYEMSYIYIGGTTVYTCALLLATLYPLQVVVSAGASLGTDSSTILGLQETMSYLEFHCESSNIIASLE